MEEPEQLLRDPECYTLIGSAIEQSMRKIGERLEPLKIMARLSPPIFMDDIGERNTAHRPEPPHWIADRQQSIRVDTGWQAECGLGFLLEPQAQRGQCRTQTERSCREQYILHCRVDG